MWDVNKEGGVWSGQVCLKNLTQPSLKYVLVTSHSFGLPLKRYVKWKKFANESNQNLQQEESIKCNSMINDTREIATLGKPPRLKILSELLEP